MGDFTFHFFDISELPVGDFSHSPGLIMASTSSLSQSVLSPPWCIVNSVLEALPHCP